jgi:hypothetical protein
VSALRLYLPGECGADGYPLAWHTSIKHDVREQAGHRCVRCSHPFVCGQTPGEWSPCDERCEHRGPLRVVAGDGEHLTDVLGNDEATGAELVAAYTAPVEARWRILTVHHLDGDKLNCRWWNLAALCQRCHLTIQGKVVMDRRWPHEHSDWFKPYVAGYYAFAYLGEEVAREQAVDRMGELLALECRQLALDAPLSEAGRAA